MNIDDWFANIRSKYASEMQCGKGCTACCHGLFDISLTDAVHVARGFEKLSDDVKKHVELRAAELHRNVVDASDGSVPTLFAEDDPRIDRIVDGANSPPCPLLGESGECLIYEDRPMSCRLEGVPMVDVRDGLFGDWCELNFEDGFPDAARQDFELDYDRINAREESESAAVASRAGLDNPRAITFIPSVIAEHENFWKKF